MPEVTGTSARNSTTRRLLRITWPFFAIVVTLVLLASESLQIVSASRAYVGGESFWSKAQKEAVYHLFRYAQSRSESDYRAYRGAIAVTLGDRRARLELEKPEPDLAVVREGFIAGNNDPRDIAGMIMLFRRFRDVGFMRNAIAIWEEADERIAELDSLAAQLHALTVDGDTSSATLEPILVRIDGVNRQLTPLEVAFSTTLGEASRRTQAILEAAIVLAATLLMIAGIVITRRMLRTSDVLEAQLYAEHDRAQVTLESIGDAVITTDEHGRVEYLNPVAESLTGMAGVDARGLSLERVLRIVKDSDREAPVSPAAELLRAYSPVKLGSDTILLRGDGGELAVDASAAPIRDRSARIVGTVLVLKDVTRERQHAALLSHQAQHDGLTGLVNRREFEQRLSRALAGAAELERTHAVLYLDLDRFKEVNDSCGHAAGDELLREISGLFQRSLRERDTLARLGGDEFAVLLENCALEDATRIAESLRHAVAEFKFVWEERRFRPGVSIGVVPLAGSHYSVAEVISIADASCYKAKDAGRDRIHVHVRADDTKRRHG